MRRVMMMGQRGPKWVAACAVVSLALVQGCNSADSVQGQDQAVHAPISIPPLNPSDPSPPSSTGPSDPVPVPAAGSPCHSTDVQKLCLALKWVAYTDSAGKAVMTQSQALSDLTTINSVWSQCQISFQLDEILNPNPVDYKLTLNTANLSELDSIRKAFMDSSTLLVVTTGTWNRSGSLGSTAANAWTNMPGDGIYGAVLEAPMADFGNIYAHELGHYLNLAHVSDASDIMNPVIYNSSTALTASQCSAARAAAISYWTLMMR